MMFKAAYWFFSYLGMMIIWAAFILGFRHEPDAPAANIAFNVLLYGAFIAVHMAMTMPAFKKAVFRERAGTPFERRIYITVSVVTWLALFWLHKPTGGFGWVAPVWLQYLGLCAYLLCLVAFFQFTKFEDLGSFLGMPGSELSHSVGAETPQMTEGAYAKVRHPMYQAATVSYFTSLLIHPNAGQLLFAVLISATFVAFIPFEEYQLLRARGDEYRAYMARTPYRLIPGIW
jgi:protein-S-isoprenylcysteine O-methyltransferase Ste14